MDEPSVTIEIIIILSLIIANGVFAMTEMAIVSSRKARLEKMADDGDGGAKIALELAENPDRMLSAIQVGITLIGILTGTFGGAALAQPLAQIVSSVFPLTAAQSHAVSLAAVVAMITYISLIVGELVPKRFALNNPEKIAAMIARPMKMFTTIASPIVKFLSFSTGLVIKVLGIKQSEESPVTEDEILILMEQGREAGTFEQAEQEMVDKIFRLADLRASALMTPRTQMVWLDLEDDSSQNLAIIAEGQHTRFPVAKGSLDEFAGVLYTGDIISHTINAESTNEIDIEKYIRTPIFVPRSMKALKILELFRQVGAHEAVVLDEYGGVDGFITLHDIMEHIIGEMPIGLEEEPMIVKRSENSWLIDGLFDIDDFKELFDLEVLPDEDKDQFKTVGGFIISYLGHIPVTAETFEWNSIRFEVVDMDRVRIDKVLVTRITDLNKSLDE